MAKKRKAIPAVSFDTLIKGFESVEEDRRLLGPDAGDSTVSLVRALHKEHKPEVILAIDYRLRALAKLIGEGEGKPWTYAVEEDGGHMINEALLRAAARAPLFEAKIVKDVRFDLEEFMKIALEESDTEGQA